jgi:hypothetical protein
MSPLKNTFLADANMIVARGYCEILKILTSAS